MAGQFTRYGRLVGICFVLMGCVVHPSSSQNPGSSSNDAVLQWNRDGGFAGFCDEMKISAGGAVATSSCRPPGAGPARTLAGNDAATFNRWRGAFGQVSIESKDAATADGMSLKLTLQGTGKGQPTQADRQEMLDWAQRVYTQSRS